MPNARRLPFPAFSSFFHPYTDLRREETLDPTDAPDSKTHIFDVDHTLTHHSTGRRLVQIGREQGFIRLRAVFDLPFLYARYRLGLLDIESVTRPITPLIGKPEEELTLLGEESYRRGSSIDLYRDMEQFIAELRRQGREVILASTSFRFLLEPIARRLDATAIVCSELEMVDGKATGNLVGGPCYAEEKARRVEAYFRREGASLQEASFYTDSHHDLPLLEMVGTPVVVNPDLRLRLRARREGWKILEPK